MNTFVRGRCAVCGEEEIQYFPEDIRSWSPELAPGLEDTQLLNYGFSDNAQQITSVITTHVSMCRHCGYCAADIFADTEIKRGDVESYRYRSGLYRRTGISSMHSSALRLALGTDDIHGIAYHGINLAWLSDVELNLFSRRTVSVLIENADILQNSTLLSILDISRTNAFSKECKQLIEILENRDLTDQERKILDFQRHLIEKDDERPHFMSDAMDFQRGE